MDLLNVIIVANVTLMDVLLSVMGCILAVVMGGLLAKKQARAYGTANAEGLPHVIFFDYGDMRFLHLGSPAVQGSMKISQPFEIHLDYVQRMMGWLLFTNLDRVSQLRAMQLGLGAASLTKFCHKQLGMDTTAVELNPQVIDTCRRWFHLPPDNARLKVLLADAAEAVTQAQWHENIDVLHVDLYDAEAARPALDTHSFYSDCRELLTQDGCMVVNLFGKASKPGESLKIMASIFGEAAIWVFKPTPAGNVVVLAFKTPRTPDDTFLVAQAQQIQARWSLPTEKWLAALSLLKASQFST
jgi:spermidine synthase